jgi:hypothetical protein
VEPSVDVGRIIVDVQKEISNLRHALSLPHLNASSSAAVLPPGSGGTSPKHSASTSGVAAATANFTGSAAAPSTSGVVSNAAAVASLARLQDVLNVAEQKLQSNADRLVESLLSSGVETLNDSVSFAPMPAPPPPHTSLLMLPSVPAALIPPPSRSLLMSRSTARTSTSLKGWSPSNQGVEFYGDEDVNLRSLMVGHRGEVGRSVGTRTRRRTDLIRLPRQSGGGTTSGAGGTSSSVDPVDQLLHSAATAHSHGTGPLPKRRVCVNPTATAAPTLLCLT